MNYVEVLVKERSGVAGGALCAMRCIAHSADSSARVKALSWIIFFELHVAAGYAPSAAERKA